MEHIFSGILKYFSKTLDKFQTNLKQTNLFRPTWESLTADRGASATLHGSP